MSPLPEIRQAAGRLAELLRPVAGDVKWVAPENTRAVGFYESCGWVLDGSQKRMSIGGHELTAARYQKTLGV